MRICKFTDAVKINQNKRQSMKLFKHRCRSRIFSSVELRAVVLMLLSYLWTDRKV
jgi:hypothetical protein